MTARRNPDWQPHIRNNEKRRAMANRFKGSKDPFRIVIVRDMWLTGFDANGMVRGLPRWVLNDCLEHRLLFRGFTGLPDSP